MIQSIFDNIENEISAHIKKSDSRIFIAVAWFTNQRLFDELNKALSRGVEVKVLIIDDILNRNEFGLDYGILVNNGADVRFSVSQNGTMHNKFCIIDDKVITGSYNWTYHANKNNENIVVIDESDITNSFCSHFESLFNSCVPIKLPYEYLKWTDVKEGDFSELRRNIFREVIAQDDVHRELKRIKLINLDRAYKSGSIDELANAASLPIEERFRTITDVLTSRSQDYTFKLWEENIVGKALDNVDGHDYIGKWFFIPYAIKEDRYHSEYIEGSLLPNASRNSPGAKGLNLKINDEVFLSNIKKILCSKTLSIAIRKYIPDNMLRIDFARMFYYQFPYPMFNKNHPKTWKNTMPRTISGINILGIIKEINGDKIVFFDGWNPQVKGEKIMNEFFVKTL